MNKYWKNKIQERLEVLESEFVPSYIDGLKELELQSRQDTISCRKRTPTQRTLPETGLKMEYIKNALCLAVDEIGYLIMTVIVELLTYKL